MFGCFEDEKCSFVRDIFKQEKKKMAGYLHRTATTAYPCCVPTLGEFSRSWSCKTCRRKDKGMREKLKVEKMKV